MEPQREWRFDFDMVPLSEQSIPRQLAENLLNSAAIPWAEEHGYGVGIGLWEGIAPIYFPKDHWRFGGGLCITKKRQVIPETDAQELLLVIRRFAESNDCQIIGGFSIYD